MRSASRPGRGTPPADDLTARARIRDAAILRFARDGFGASLRSVAEDAGVSAALVIHHFGSKDRLRHACDDHVFALIRENKREVVSETGGPTAFLGQMARVAEFAPLVGYAIRSLQTGGDGARGFVEHMIADAVDYLRDGVAAGTITPSRDEHARARYLVESALGTLLLELSINPPADPSDLAGIMDDFFERIAGPALELYTEGLLTDRRMLDAYLLYVGDPPEESADPASA
ncbi:TetR/AcrR family transcriptional regulator [Oerskovia flava]|uniref:TetR/AcrR family transcriptional regulator n=1 Tax=Oerskovia flava TaxID=2986422 RepID=UPI00223EC339|nr:TetR family transcriptional regulator [Oerskovia sp. JB1-3-2]